MNPETINWTTVIVSVILALIAAAVPVTLSALLGRKNANKKLQLDETTVMLSGTDSQIKAYQDLLDRADAAATRAEANNKEFAEKIKELEEQKRDQDWKIATLSTLFQRVVSRSNITLTTEEQQIFEQTKPSYMFGRPMPRQKPT